jgi:hypothetical protein
VIGHAAVSSGIEQEVETEPKQMQSAPVGSKINLNAAPHNGEALLLSSLGRVVGKQETMRLFSQITFTRRLSS